MQTRFTVWSRYPGDGRLVRRIKRLLESSIELSDTILNAPTKPHDIGLNGKVLSGVQKRLSAERTDLGEVATLQKLLAVAEFPRKFNKQLSYKFWEGFFWRRCVDESVFFNAWTMLMHSSSTFAQFYIDTFCPATLKIFYNGSSLFSAQDEKLRPKICIRMNTSRQLIATLFEVAVETMSKDVVHKDDVKLFKCMRRVLDEQLQRVEPAATGVFG